MKREKLLCAFAGAVLAWCIPAGAQEQGNWRAANSPAQAITGDVTLSPEKIFINFAGFVIARIRDLEPNEVSAVFDVDSGAAGRGSLYRLNIPAAQKFLHHNTMCGSDETQWMATYAAGHSLHLAFLSGQKMPAFTPEAFANSTDLCGTFAYAR